MLFCKNRKEIKNKTNKHKIKYNYPTRSCGRKPLFLL